MSSSARRSSECPIFGSPKNISERCLPTYKEVMKYYIYVRLQIKQRKDPLFKAIAAVVAQSLEILWKKASIPHLSRKRITSMLQQNRHKMNNLLKSKSKNCDNYKRKFQLLQDLAHKNLFDVSACKCLDIERCTCKLKNRVPLAERDFLCDQRSDRRMVITELDKVSTILNKKRKKRRLETAKQFHLLPLCSETSCNTSKAVMLSEDQSASEISDSKSSEYNVPATSERRQKRFLLTFLFLLKLVIALVYQTVRQRFLLHLCCKVLESSRKMMHHQLLTKQNL